MCTECIVEHSGHKFCKQEHSGIPPLHLVPLLKEKVAQIQNKLKTQHDLLDQQTKVHDFTKEQLTLEHQRNVPFSSSP